MNRAELPATKGSTIVHHRLWRMDHVHGNNLNWNRCLPSLAAMKILQVLQMRCQLRTVRKFCDLYDPYIRVWIDKLFTLSCMMKSPTNEMQFMDCKRLFTDHKWVLGSYEMINRIYIIITILIIIIIPIIIITIYWQYFYMVYIRHTN